MDLTALKTELNSGHPDTGPYDTDDVTAANQLNAVNRTKEAPTLSGSQIFNAIVPSEYDALTAAVQARVRDVYLLGDSIDVRSGTNTRAVLLSAFNGASTTRANLLAVVTIAASRADELGLGRVTESDVADARRLP